MPFKNNIRKNLEKLDKKAIDLIIKLDSESFIDYVKEKKATICGFSPIATLIELAKLNSIRQAKLLKYYTSGDIVGEYSSSVSYASILFS